MSTVDCRTFAGYELRVVAVGDRVAFRLTCNATDGALAAFKLPRASARAFTAALKAAVKGLPPQTSKRSASNGHS